MQIQCHRCETSKQVLTEAVILRPLSSRIAVHSVGAIGHLFISVRYYFSQTAKTQVLFMLSDAFPACTAGKDNGLGARLSLIYKLV